MDEAGVIHVALILTTSDMAAGRCFPLARPRGLEPCLLDLSA
jgi:hypothetical protein